MAQVPALRPVTVVPETAQMLGVTELKVIGNPEAVVAVIDPVPPVTRIGLLPNAIDWLALTMVDLMTLGAA